MNIFNIYPRLFFSGDNGIGGAGTSSQSASTGDTGIGGAGGAGTSAQSGGGTAGASGTATGGAQNSNPGGSGFTGTGTGQGGQQYVFIGKDGKYYATQALKDAADAAYDADAKAKADAAAADLASRTGPDGTVYSSAQAMQAAQTVKKDETALGNVKSGAMENAQKVSLAAQGGAVNSAVEGAKASGMSPAQAALMGSQQGSDVYQKQLSTNYNTEYGIEQNAASQKYAQDISYQLGLSGQDLQKWLAENQDQLQIKLAQMGLDAQQMQNVMSALGAIAMSAGSAVISGLSDKNAKYDIHDGYGMLDRVVKEVGPKVWKYKGDNTERVGPIAQDIEKTPLSYTVHETPQGKAIDTSQMTLANTSMISELSKKLDDALAYIKKGGK